MDPLPQVCSHWTAVLTWRSFVCAVVVSLTFELLVELVDADAVDEVTNIVIIIFASENNSNIQCHKNIVVGWAGSHRELVDNILLCDKELYLGPWQAKYEAALLLNVIELSVLCNNCISSFRSVENKIKLG